MSVTPLRLTTPADCVASVGLSWTLPAAVSPLTLATSRACVRHTGRSWRTRSRAVDTSHQRPTPRTPTSLQSPSVPRPLALLSDAPTPECDVTVPADSDKSLVSRHRPPDSDRDTWHQVPPEPDPLTPAQQPVECDKASRHEQVGPRDKRPSDSEVTSACRQHQQLMV